MRKTTKMWLVAGAFLVLLGCMIFIGVLAVSDFDFTKLSTVKYETNEYNFGEEFCNISVDTNTADIIFEVSNDGKCRVECYEESKAKHSVTVKQDTLFINITNEKAWYDYIGISFGSPKIRVYLPKAEYSTLSVKGSTGYVDVPKGLKFDSADVKLSTGGVRFFASASDLVKLKASTGNITVEGISAGSLDFSVSTGNVTISDVRCMGDVKIKVSTGKTKLNDVECKKLTSSGSTGDISLYSVIAKEAFSIKRSTGDVKFDGSDAKEIFVETDTGDVTGSLLTEKVFITHTDTGKVDAPKTTVGGKCEINTDTGDIRLEIK